MSPPGERGGRPRHCRAARRIAATARQHDPTSVTATEDDAGYREWRAALVADAEVGIEALAHTLRSLNVHQLRGLRWIGLMDEGCSRMYRELARRGEVL